MLTVEIRVNGTVVSIMRAVNRGPLDDVGMCRYEYEVATLPYESAQPMRVVQGTIEHKRSDGAEALVAALCEKAAPRKKKK